MRLEQVQTAPETLPPPLLQLRMGRAWDNPADHLRALGLQRKGLQPNGESSQQQRAETNVRASRGCSRRAKRTAGASDVRTSSPMQSTPRCRSQSPHVPSLRQRDWISPNGRCHARRLLGSYRLGQAATEGSKGCTRPGTPESRSCEACIKRSRWSPCEWRQRLHQIQNGLEKVPKVHAP